MTIATISLRRVLLCLTVSLLAVGGWAQVGPVAPPQLVAADLGTFQPQPAGTPLRLVAPRGGYASALAILSGPRLAKVTSAPPALTGPGNAAMPADAVQVRWLAGAAMPDVFTPTPTGTQQQYALLTVHAPANAAPGRYTGIMRITAEGFEGSLPVELDVATWQVTAPRDWRMLVGMIHSPDTVALQYKVEPWSEAHLKYMEPSLALLRDIGGETCTVFLIADGVVCERYSMVRRRADGTPDFTCMDRYLDLWERVCGQPKSVTLYLWDNRAHPAMGSQQSYTPEKSVKVTRINADGTLENVEAPYYTTAEAMPYWKPVFEGVRERMRKRGWADTEVLLGIIWDTQPQEEAVDFLKAAAPGWRWRVFGHGFNVPLVDATGKLTLACGAEVGWFEGTGPIGFGQMAGKFPALIKSATTKRTYPFTVGCRDQATLNKPGWAWRDAPASTVRAGIQGMSQVGIDYWPIPRWPGGDLIRSGGGGFNPRGALAKSITVPGPNGAEPRLQYELLREGMQAAEAFQQVRDTDPRVLADAQARATAAALAFDAFVKGRVEQAFLPRGVTADPPARAQERWNAAVADLYRAAGEVQAATPGM